MDLTTATDLGSADERAGGKAAGLAALIAAGLPVPPGIVLDPRGGTPHVLATLAADVARERGWTAVAVRSSGRDEDGAERSSAGAYETVLDVPGDDVAALAEAIAAVTRSMGDTAAGVIVQRMVPADAAGVAFTVDPLTGGRCVVVNAVAGLGDALVSGAATPWETRLVRGAGESVTLPARVDGPLDHAALGEVARLAIAAETVRGRPQDVEWAVDDGTVWLLQSRPVTALVEQIPVEIVVPPGYWVRDPTHGRLPRTRMTSSVVDENVATRAMVEESGTLATFRGAVIGGWHYVTIVPVGAPPPAPGKRPPELPGWLVSLLVRTSREGRRQLRAARRAAATDAAGRLHREWDTRLRDEQRARILACQDVELGGLDDAALAAELRTRAETMRRSAELHFRLGVPYEFGIHRLVAFCARRLGWTADRSLQLLSGLADVASEPGRELAAIAAMREDSAERVEALERFRRFFGCRALDIEVAEPTLAESPRLLDALIAAAGRAGTADTAAAQSADRSALAMLARAVLPRARVAEFDEVLANAEQVYGLRDDNVFLQIDAPLAVLRYAALEAGRRLAERGTIDGPEDVFHLTPEEAADALEASLPLDDLREWSRRARGERAWAIAHPGPLSYGDDPGPGPRFTLLTRAERTPTEAMMLMGELIMPASVDAAAVADGVLRGTPASPGRVTGPVRLVHAEADFHRLQPGDILVCAGTRPSWSVIFPLIGGLVADGGGSLSHPAIIAREHGVPAVVAVVGATGMLRDGEVVTVDGGAGTVTRA